MEAILVYLGMAIGIAFITIKDDLAARELNRKIADGYKLNPIDRDKDGLVQEGTKWERKAKRK